MNHTGAGPGNPVLTWLFFFFSIFILFRPSKTHILNKKKKKKKKTKNSFFPYSPVSFLATVFSVILRTDIKYPDCYLKMFLRPQLIISDKDLSRR